MKHSCQNNGAAKTFFGGGQQRGRLFVGKKIRVTAMSVEHRFFGGFSSGSTSSRKTQKA